MDSGPHSQPTPAGSGDHFVRVGARDNFYQSCAFIPMSFALVTTVYENGETGIGPHALCFPFNVTPPYSMFLISRGSSGTATNIRRTGRCALNYIEFDRGRLSAIAALGYPGQDMAAKRKPNPFTLVPSPTATEAGAPLIVSEAAICTIAKVDETAGYVVRTLSINSRVGSVVCSSSSQLGSSTHSASRLRTPVGNCIHGHPFW